MFYLLHHEIRLISWQWIRIIKKLHLIYLLVVLQESVVALTGHLPYGEDPVKEETEGTYSHFSYTMFVYDTSNWWVEVTHIYINVFEKLFALCTGWYLFEAALNHNRSLSLFYEFWNDLHLFSVGFPFSPYLSFPREYTIGIINRF